MVSLPLLADVFPSCGHGKKHSVAIFTVAAVVVTEK